MDARETASNVRPQQDPQPLRLEKYRHERSYQVEARRVLGQRPLQLTASLVIKRSVYI